MKSKVLLGLALSGLTALPVVAGDAAGVGKLDGTWLAVSFEKGGKKAPKEVLEKSQIVLHLRGNKYKAMAQGEEQETGTFKLDPDKKPATIDLMIAGGRDKDKLQLGIYRLEGETLTLCLGRPGVKERPTAFTAEEGGDFFVFVLKRKKEEKPESR
jgi:uncharacterized protein (TIGR03067 family)